eukprot:TRINITY_DN39084_c0_g1_i1.p1 TRINITY_DN39084_c0_g1~~TRINITY_DN39084_c0_g1_i1.p1  ORF type:complete len:411 (+),score=79.16 TRINITY_DN39084_c0_g1_i1:34-1233(+)
MAEAVASDSSPAHAPVAAAVSSAAEPRRSEAEIDPADVAKGEGVLRPLQAVPGILAHTVGNIVGGASLSAGWALGKADAKLRGGVKQVSDSRAFKAGFRTWLYANGVWPTVLHEAGPYGNDFEPVPQDAEVRRRLFRSTPLIISNHVSYLDTVVLPLVLDVPKLMAMKEVSKWPFFSQLCQEMDMVWVDRSCPESRHAAKEAIQQHVEAWRDGERPLLMWPEGTTSNGQSLKEFKSGAFSSGKSVRPVVIKYTGEWDPANVNFREATLEEQPKQESGEKSPVEKVDYGDAEWAQQFLGHLIHSCTVLVCKPYHPSAAEKADPELYKANVRTLMIERLKELTEFIERQNRTKEQTFGADKIAEIGVAAGKGLAKGVDRLVDFMGRGFREAGERFQQRQGA